MDFLQGECHSLTESLIGKEAEMDELTTTAEGLEAEITRLERGYNQAIRERNWHYRRSRLWTLSCCLVMMQRNWTWKRKYTYRSLYFHLRRALFQSPRRVTLLANLYQIQQHLQGCRISMSFDVIAFLLDMRNGKTIPN